MRRFILVALVIGFAFGWACGQQSSAAAPALQTDAKPERVKVYAVGPGVTAPELIPSDAVLTPIDKCIKKIDGEVELSLLVDEAGAARNIMFIKPLGNDLDRLALLIADTDRFKPGMIDGKPVIVAQSVEIKIQSCFIESDDSAGKKAYHLRQRSAPRQKFDKLPNPPDEAVFTPGSFSSNESGSAAPPIEKVGGGVSAPHVLNSVEAKFSDEARKAHFSGTCLLSLIVDSQGMAQDLQVTKGIGHGLDEEALKAVNKYRFRPAMKDGEPVPVKITVEVNFKPDEYN